MNYNLKSLSSFAGLLVIAQWFYKFCWSINYSVIYLLSFENIPIQYVEMFDEDDLPEGNFVSDEMRSFINGIANINRVYRILGIEASDIRPENLGYRDGELVAFDIDDRNR